VRTDVYALGVILYQMLIGDFRQPMAPGWERNIEDEMLREDLARATDGDPQRRFASAAVLAQALRELDARKAVRAHERASEQEARRAQSALQRSRARRPWVVATVCGLALGLCASLWLAAQTQRARARAEQQAVHAEAVSGFLQDLLVNADPAAAGEYDLSVREALGRAAAGLEQRFAGAPLAEAAVRLTAGDLYASLGEAANAAAHIERAVALFEADLGASSPTTLRARYRFGEALAGASDYSRAERILAAADADAAALGENRAIALDAERAWGRYYLRQARAGEALPRLQNAERHQLAIAAEDAVALHALRMDLAQAYSHSGRPEEAVTLLNELESTVYAGVSDAQRARALLMHGAALLYAGRFEEAEPKLIAAIDALANIYGPDSLQSAQARSALGGLFVSSGRFADALPQVVASRETMCRLHGPSAQSCLMQIGNEGVVRLQMGDAAGAIVPLTRARAAFEEQAGAGSAGAHVLGFYLASAALQIGDAARAAELVELLDPALLAAGSPGTQWQERVDALRGSILLAQDRRKEGLVLLKSAVNAMQAGGMQEWILAPFAERLKQAELPPP
jgi:non-specific serine/threonine protein kinase